MVGTTKYTEEQIHFILDRTVKIIPRGETRRVHDQAVRDFKQRYGIEDFGVNQVRYITERYGSDPVYGNRWANMVKGKGISPASDSMDSELRPLNNAMVGANQALRKVDSGKHVVCEHCRGLGTIPVSRAQTSPLSFGLQSTATQPQIQETRAIQYPNYRSQNYQARPKHQAPTEQALLGRQQQQSTENTLLRTQAPSLTPGLSTSALSIATANRNSEIGSFSSEAGIGFESEHPVGPIDTGNRRRIQRVKRKSQGGHPEFLGYPQTVPRATPAVASQKASSAYHLVPTTSGTTSNTQISQTFQPLVLDSAGTPGFEIRPLGYGPAALGTLPPTVLGKHQRSVSNDSFLTHTENAPTPISMQSPYQWQTDGNKNANMNANMNAKTKSNSNSLSMNTNVNPNLNLNMNMAWPQLDFGIADNFAAGQNVGDGTSPTAQSTLTPLSFEPEDPQEQQGPAKRARTDTGNQKLSPGWGDDEPWNDS